jgi:hypothetical protein
MREEEGRYDNVQFLCHHHIYTVHKIITSQK